MIQFLFVLGLISTVAFLWVVAAIRAVAATRDIRDREERLYWRRHHESVRR